MKRYQVILSYNGTSEELTVNPAGWDKFGVSYVRHEVYHSVLRNFTLPLRFAKITGGGYDFIESAYNVEGIASNVQVVINKRNHLNNKFELFINGSIDMKTRIVSRNYIEVSIMDGMKLQRLISRDEINFDLKSTSSADNISVTGFGSQKTITFSPIDILLSGELMANYNESGFLEFDTSVLPNIKTPVYSLNEMGDRLNFDETTIIYTNSTTEQTEVKLSFNGNFSRSGVGGGSVGARIHYVLSVETYNEDLVKLTEDVIIFEDFDLSGGGATYNRESLVNFNKKLIIPANGYINLNLSIETFNAAASYIVSSSLQFNITEYSPGEPASTSDVIYPHEAFSRLIQLATSELNTSNLLYSEHFGRTDSEFRTYIDNGEGALDAIFNGYMVRKYLNYALNANFRDLFKTFDAIYSLGLGYDKTNDRFYIEKKRDFFDSGYFMFDLGEVKDLQKKPALKYYFSKITGGYNHDGEYNDYQGAYEFNLKREYSTSVPVKDESIISAPYRADSIAVELARRKQYFDNASLDTDYDKEVFIVRTNSINPVLNSNVSGFAGVEQYYNTMLTPRQNAKRWGNTIRACLYKNTNPIKFQNSAKTCSLIIDSVNEFSDIQQSEIDSALFVPELLSFKSYISTNFISILNNNPHGYITFTYEGISYEGYILSVETGDYNKEASYELLAKEVVSSNNKQFEEAEGFLFEEGNNYKYES